MKIKGKKIEKANEVICPIPRGNGDDIIFVAGAVLDYDEFDRLCPLPEPPMVKKPSGELVKVTDDEGFLEQINIYGTRKTNWIVLRSLQSTPELEWETVDMQNPKTWDNWKDELRDAKFNDAEILRIQNSVWSANSLNEALVAQARENFLKAQQEQEEQSTGQNTQVGTMQSGTPASE